MSKYKKGDWVRVRFTGEILARVVRTKQYLGTQKILATAKFLAAGLDARKETPEERAKRIRETKQGMDW